MPLIDYETQEPIVCPGCGERDNLSVAQFVFGSQVVCNECGGTCA